MWGRGWGGVGHVNVPCTLHTLLMFLKCQDVGQGLGWGGAPCSYQCHTEEGRSHCLSPIVSELVFQLSWRQHQGPMSPTQFFTALQRLLKTLRKMGRNEDTQMFLARSADEQTSVRVAKSDRNATAVCAACT